jgi:translation initiation factor IF-2
MQQRRLRLGDILDDYCPRERRITNHVVVAMIEDEVKQTRCGTCDADHEYKQAKAPASRRRKPAAALARELSDAPRPRPAVASADTRQDTPIDDTLPDAELDTGDVLEPTYSAAADLGDDSTDSSGPGEAEVDAFAAADDEDADGGERHGEDEGPVHRPLIRATLPRPEGQVPERKEPDFTFRNGRGFDGNRNGQRQHRGQRPKQAHGQGHGQGTRFGTPRSGSGQGQRFGFGQSSGQGQRQGNRQGQAGGGGQRSGRPGGPGRGPRPGGQGQGRGPKRGR